MSSLAHELRSRLEGLGEYVVTANASSGWFAVFLATWQKRLEWAQKNGRDGPNLIVYRTRSLNPRDHYAIPHSVVQPLLRDDTLTRSEVNGSVRWNLTLKNGKLHVTHQPGSVEVAAYHGLRLIGEGPAFSMPGEVLPGERFPEGVARQILVNAYERDPRARQRCNDHHGMNCAVCGMSFAERYGPKAAGIVHVHHLRPLSRLRREYKVDPVKDLRPVCPNCHAVIHSDQNCYSIEDVRKLFLERASKGLSGDVPNKATPADAETRLRLRIGVAE